MIIIFSNRFTHPLSISHRRCITGEGVFHFTTTRGEEIMKELKKAVANWSSIKSNFGSGSSIGSSSTPPKSCNRKHSNLMPVKKQLSAPTTPDFYFAKPWKAKQSGSPSHSRATRRSTAAEKHPILDKSLSEPKQSTSKLKDERAHSICLDDTYIEVLPNNN